MLHKLINKMKLLFTFFFSVLLYDGFGQSSDTYFHSASGLYIHGKMKEAKEAVTKGLQQFPDNPELRALKEKIKEEERQEEQNKKNQEQQNQDKQQQQQQNKKDEQEKKEQQQQQQEQQQQQAEKNDEKKAEPRQAQISKADAEKLLDALKNEEQKVQLKLQKNKGKSSVRKVEKDW
jgi:Ca-activated chloride channel homolog